MAERQGGERGGGHAAEGVSETSLGQERDWFGEERVGLVVRGETPQETVEHLAGQQGRAGREGRDHLDTRLAIGSVVIAQDEVVQSSIVWRRERDRGKELAVLHLHYYIIFMKTHIPLLLLLLLVGARSIHIKSQTQLKGDTEGKGETQGEEEEKSEKEEVQEMSREVIEKMFNYEI